MSRFNLLLMQRELPPSVELLCEMYLTAYQNDPYVYAVFQRALKEHWTVAATVLVLVDVLVAMRREDQKDRLREVERSPVFAFASNRR